MHSLIALHFKCSNIIIFSFIFSLEFSFQCIENLYRNHGLMNVIGVLEILDTWLFSRLSLGHAFDLAHLGCEIILKGKDRCVHLGFAFGLFMTLFFFVMIKLIYFAWQLGLVVVFDWSRDGGSIWLHLFWLKVIWIISVKSAIKLFCVKLFLMLGKTLDLFGI